MVTLVLGIIAGAVIAGISYAVQTPLPPNPLTIIHGPQRDDDDAPATITSEDV